MKITTELFFLTKSHQLLLPNLPPSRQYPAVHIPISRVLPVPPRQDLLRPVSETLVPETILMCGHEYSSHVQTHRSNALIKALEGLNPQVKGYH